MQLQRVKIFPEGDLEFSPLIEHEQVSMAVRLGSEFLSTRFPELKRAKEIELKAFDKWVDQHYGVSRYAIQND